MKKLFLLSLLSLPGLFAQVPLNGAPNGLAVNQVGGPPAGPLVETIPVLSGTTTIAICYSPSKITNGLRASTSVAISAISKANPAVITSAGHGFSIYIRPQVTISGATGTGWVTGINGTFTATVIDANTFSIPVDSTGFGTLAGTVVFKTTAPRSGVNEWSVMKNVFDASGNFVAQGWLAGSDTWTAKCSDASLSTTNLQ